MIAERFLGLDSEENGRYPENRVFAVGSQSQTSDSLESCSWFVAFLGVYL